MTGPATTSVERFLASIEIRNARQCWWWLGATHRGYPVFYLPRSEARNPWVMASRFAWEIAFERGTLGPSEIIIRAEHDWEFGCPGFPACPHILCMNPDHMRVGTRHQRGVEFAAYLNEARRQQ